MVRRMAPEEAYMVRRRQLHEEKEEKPEAATTREEMKRAENFELNKRYYLGCPKHPRQQIPTTLVIQETDA